jgi:cobalt-zinc-cadmium resistance protein CzcA
VRGATEVLTVANDNVDYLQLNVDRVAAGRLGMPVDQLQDTLRASVEGMPAGIVAEGQRRVPIVIRGDDALRSDPTRFADMQMVTPRARGARGRHGAGGAHHRPGQARSRERLALRAGPGFRLGP